MLDRIKDIKKDALIRGGIILFVMLIIYNFFNYAFQISMAKMLGPADYSILAVLMSLIYIFSIPSEAIQTMASKYTSKFNVNKDLGKMKDLLYRGLKKGFNIAFCIFLIFVLLCFFLSSFLKIELLLLISTGIFIFYVFSVSAIRGILQGQKKFTALGANLIIESLAKLLFTVFLVFIGWRVYGAIWGIVIGFAISLFASVLSIKDVVSSKRKKENFGEAYKTNLALLISITVIVLMYSLDIILARRFFTPEIAGQYAFVSLIGKVVIFVSSSIGKAMFPLSSEEFEKGNKNSGLLKKAIFLVLSISLGISFFYLLFPEFIIKIISLGSSEYLAASNILFIVGLAFSFTSLSNIILLYKLSINQVKIKHALFMGIFIVIQIVLMATFNSSLLIFSCSLLLINLIMFLYTLWLLKK
jgi:O-antigen/teichoic acid export membrane protein